MSEERKIHEGFKKMGGDLVPDLGAYVRDYLAKHDDVKVYVGIDSEQHKRHTTYGMVVILYHDKKGGHLVFKRDNAHDPATGKRIKIRDMFQKLWKEVELAEALGSYFETELEGHYKRFTIEELMKRGYGAHQDKLVDIDLDLNPDEGPTGKNKSNRVHDAAVSYISGLGYRVRTKPHAWAASCAADLIVDKSNPAKRKGRN
jgi:predicted RNase H-related nuclease YkuK (DUF458 family)